MKYRGSTSGAVMRERAEARNQIDSVEAAGAMVSGGQVPERKMSDADSCSTCSNPSSVLALPGGRTSRSWGPKVRSTRFCNFRSLRLASMNGEFRYFSLV